MKRNVMDYLAVTYDRLSRVAGTVRNDDAEAAILVEQAKMRLSAAIRLLREKHSDAKVLFDANGRRRKPPAHGAYFVQSVGRWKAKATYARKQYHLGYFDTEEQAKAAYIAFWAERGISHT